MHRISEAQAELKLLKMNSPKSPLKSELLNNVKIHYFL